MQTRDGPQEDEPSTVLPWRMVLKSALGLRQGTVDVVPYDARWIELFHVAEATLLDALGSAVIAIHHVGSTAVPGLCAKPILDLLVSIPDFERARELVPVLKALDYEFRPAEDIPDRHFFRQPPGGGIRLHHLSLAEPTSKHHVVTLAFRDALCRDAELANDYAKLKRKLAMRFPRDRPAYIHGKSEFIRGVLASEGLE